MTNDVKVRWEVSNSTFGNLLDFTSLDTVKLVFPQSLPSSASPTVFLPPWTGAYNFWLDKVHYVFRVGQVTNIDFVINNTTPPEGTPVLDKLYYKFVFWLAKMVNSKINRYYVLVQESPVLSVDVNRGFDTGVLTYAFIPTTCSLTFALLVSDKEDFSNVIGRTDIVGKVDCF